MIHCRLADRHDQVLDELSQPSQSTSSGTVGLRLSRYEG